MKKIVVGTTPKIRWKFSNVNVSDIVIATMTVKKYDVVIITKTIDSATISDNEIIYTLSQSETLKIGIGTHEIMLNWVTTDGVRGTGNLLKIEGVRNHINEVL